MSEQPHSDLKDLSVVILSYNRLEEIKQSVPMRLADVKSAGLELIVVDNASEDGSVEFLESLQTVRTDFTLILNEANLGVGGGRNVGWRAATRDHILTLDDDTRIDIGTIRALRARLLSDTQCGIVFPNIRDVQTDQLLFPICADQEPTTFHGACYLTSHAARTSVGDHDARCQFGGEELDLTIRLRDAGYEVRLAGNLTADHNALVRNAKSMTWRQRHWLENHLRIIARHFRFRHALVWSLVMAAGHLRACIRQEHFGAPGALLSAAIRGFREGRREHSPVSRSVEEFYAQRFGISPALRAFFQR